MHKEHATCLRPFNVNANRLQIEALRPLSFGILSERRAVAPFGLLGGRPGAPGMNLLQRSSGRTVNLGERAVHCELVSGREAGPWVQPTMHMMPRHQPLLTLMPLLLLLHMCRRQGHSQA